MSEERLSRKAYLICQKYEIEEVLQREQQQLEELFLTSTDDRGQIGDQIERVERLGSQIKLIEDRIAREEEREAARLAAEEAGEEYQSDEESEEEENNPFARLTRILNQIRDQREENEENEESDESEESEDDEEEHQNQENQPYFMDPNIQQQFGHIFANAGSSSVLNNSQRRRNRPNQVQSPAGLLQLLQDPLSNQQSLEDLVTNLQNQLGMNIQIMPAAPGGGYEVLSELEDVQVPIRSECLAIIPIKIYDQLSTELIKDKNKRCAVCLCDYEQDDQIRHLPCDHLFHPDCIQEWFNTNAKCPVCKFDMNSLVEKTPKIITSALPPLPNTTISDNHSNLLNEIEQFREDSSE